MNPKRSRSQEAGAVRAKDGLIILESRERAFSSSGTLRDVIAGQAVGVLLIFSGVAPCSKEIRRDLHIGEKRVSHIMVSILAVCKLNGAWKPCMS